MNLLRLATRAYPRHDLTTRAQVKHNRREWIKKVQFLGDRWLGSPNNQIQRREQSL